MDFVTLSIHTTSSQRVLNNFIYIPPRENIPTGTQHFPLRPPRTTPLARPPRKTFSKKNKKNIYYDSSHNNLQLEPMWLGNGMEFIGT